MYDVENSGKADFLETYNKTTPISYYNTMRAHQYQIPQTSKATTEAILNDVIEASGGRPINVLDLGCSYGVNAAVLKYNIDLETLYQRYRLHELQTASRTELLRLDHEYYSSIQARSEMNFFGMDVAEDAVRYAVECGILSRGWCADLEKKDEWARIASGIPEIDVIISTGCVGYITEKTFEGLLRVLSPTRKPLILSYVLRMFDFSPIERCLARHGYTTVRAESQFFKQRSCVDHEERDFVIAQVHRQNKKTSHLEDDGDLYAQLFLSRPDGLPTFSEANLQQLAANQIHAIA